MQALRRAGLVVVFLVAGCDSAPCVRGETQRCLCSGGRDGVQVCLAGGEGWDWCECGPDDTDSGTPGEDGGVPTDGARPGVDGGDVDAGSPLRPPPQTCTEVDYPGTVHNVVDDGVAIDTNADQTAILQRIVDNANSGDVIRFPGLGAGHYVRMDGPVRITKPIVLLGSGDDSALEIRTRNGFIINADQVVVDGLFITGTGYGDVDLSQGAIRWGTASASDFRSGITVRRNRITDNPASALTARYWRDVLVECNTMERLTYGGVFLSVTHDVVIRHNVIREIGDNPESVRERGTSGAIIAYPILVTAAGGLAGSPATWALIYDNVLESAEWQGIHNHGCHDFIAFDNLLVDQTHGLQGVAYSYGSMPRFRFTGQMYINNEIRNTRTYIAAIDKADDARFIGNRVTGTYARSNDMMRVFGSSSGATVYGNRVDVSTAFQADGIVRIFDATGPNDAYYVGRNFVDGVRTDAVLFSGRGSGPGAPVEAPPAPVDVRLEPSTEGAWLTWDFGEDPHDSFEVEVDSGDGWTPRAFRPPASNAMARTLENNDAYEGFNAREYFLRNFAGDRVRIRANNRLASSDWVEASL
ncbi:MAG: right-handed parallel beta-helix repeat-containing protein [Myxococcota bacterium]